MNFYIKHRLPVNIVMVIFDAILLAYYIPISPIAFGSTAQYDIWYNVYNVINPFTIGAYILGIVVLLQFIMYRNWIAKVLLGIFYLYVVVSSLVVMMGMTSWTETVMYLPHIVLIILCIIAVCRKSKIAK